MPIVDRFSAWIECDGARLPEYSIECSGDGSMRTVSCWVPSEVGKCFQVVSYDSQRAYTTSHKITVDGQEDRYHFRVLPLPGLSSPATRISHPETQAADISQTESTYLNSSPFPPRPLSSTRTPTKSPCVTSTTGPLSTSTAVSVGDEPHLPSKSPPRVHTHIPIPSHSISTATHISDVLSASPCQPLVQGAGLPKGSFARFIGFSQSSTYKQPFMFSRCNIIGAENEAASPNSRKIGTIIVQVTRIELGEEMRLQSSTITPVKLLPLNVSQEATGMVHGVQLGPRKYAPTNLAKYTPITTRKERVVTFVFRYRPLEVLRLAGLTTSISSSSADVPEGTNSSSRSHAIRQEAQIRAKSPAWIDLTDVDDSEDDNPFIVHPKTIVNTGPAIRDDSREESLVPARAPRVGAVRFSPAIAKDVAQANGASKIEVPVTPINPIDLAPLSESDILKQSPQVSPTNFILDDVPSASVALPSTSDKHPSKAVKVEELCPSPSTSMCINPIDATPDEEMYEPEPKTESSDDEYEYVIDPEWVETINKLQAEVDAFRKKCTVRKKRKRRSDDSDGREVKKEVKVENDGRFSAAS